MAYNEKLVERVSSALSSIEDVERKKMFSGVSFLVNGKMCINVTSEGLMCRVDPEIHEELIEKPGCRSMIMKGRELKGWVLIDEEALQTKKQLNYWVELSLSYNEQAKSSKKKKKLPARG
jgi:TfoX/Sxy family transcriptional regulator of competence genes